MDINPELRKLTVSINSDITDYSVDIKGFENIKKFFKKEYDFWNESENKGYVISQLLNHFENLNGRINNFYNSLNTINDIDALNAIWTPLQATLEDNLSITRGRLPILYSGSSEAIHVLEIDKKFSAAHTEGAYSYFINKINFSQFNVIAYFDGVIQAYEFKYAAETNITTRRKSERIALNNIRSESRQLLVDLDAKYESHKTKFDVWKNNSEDKYNTFCDDRQKELKNLEKLYTEKLQLSGPAEFWEKRAKKYKTVGNRWITALIVSCILFLVGIALSLYNPPLSFDSSILRGEPLAIKSMLLSITFLSACAYLIRVFSKLSFSSYHLSRDSEERRQLTMVYLALLKEGAIEHEERQIVLQSIFSRTDTGLLGDDSSPTMPNIGGMGSQGS